MYEYTEAFIYKDCLQHAKCIILAGLLWLLASQKKDDFFHNASCGCESSSFLFVAQVNYAVVFM